MNGINRQQLIGALMALIVLLFLVGGLPGLRGRRELRWAAVVGYVAALTLALIWVCLWLAGIEP